MNKNFADWYQTAHLNAEHELLQRRWTGIDAFVKTLKPATAYELARLFFGLQQKDPDARSRFEAALNEADNAFTFTGRELEVSVLAGAALECALEKNNSSSTQAALSLVSPTLQGYRTTAPIPDIVQDAIGFLTNQSAALRNVDGVPARQTDVAKENVDAVVNAFTTNALPSAAEPWSKVIGSQIAQIKTLNGQITLLDKRYALLREESDMLWWLTGAHCRTLDVPFQDVPAAPAPLLIGRELADLTRQLPGPVAIEAFAWRMLNGTQKDAVKPIQLAAAVNGLDREVRERWIQPVSSHGGLDLCPILSAISQSLSVVGAKDWFSAFKAGQRLEAAQKMTPLELARQIYLESLLVK